MTIAAVDDGHPSLFAVIELGVATKYAVADPNDESMAGMVHGRNLVGYRAHELIRSAWIQDSIRVGSFHPNRSDL